MRHIIFEEGPSYPIALLIKGSSFNKKALEDNYINYFTANGLKPSEIIAFTLEYPKAKVSVKEQKDYLDNLLPALRQLGTKIIYCCDSNYFKTLTRQTKAEIHLGYSLPCAIDGYKDMHVVLGLNHHALIHNPANAPKLELGNKTVSDVYHNQYRAIGEDIIHKAWYPDSYSDIITALDSLHDYSVITCDVETFSLKVGKTGIATIAFGTSKHTGIAFPVDYQPYSEFGQIDRDHEGNYGMVLRMQGARQMLRKFFRDYKGRIVFHRGSFDIKVIIYELFMQNPLDKVGMLDGLHTLCRSIDDTLILSYLATNSTAGNELGLKAQAHEFAGNWAKDDIKDVLKIPLKDLLQYNLVDCLSAMYLYEKHLPTVIKDNQFEIYQELMIPSLKVIIQAELVGMPLNRKVVLDVKAELTKIQDAALEALKGNRFIEHLNHHFQTKEMNKVNAKLKTKQHPLSHFADIQFNPNSNPQLQYLLYELFGLPVLDLTDKGKPATGGDTLEKLINHTDNPEQITVLKALISYAQVNKILTSFIPAFEEAFDKYDGTSYLHGCFNLGGTVSGRLSSSDPNLQNLPANSVYGKLIKTCFMAPTGWLFVGADFASLEDRINALLTKDPNKLKVYAGMAVYEVTVNGITHHIREDSTIVYDGKSYTAGEFYEAYR